MKFEFVTTKMATLEAFGDVEKQCEKLMTQGWQLHSWSHKPDGGVTVLMLLVPQQAPKPETPDGIPLRTARIGAPNAK